MCSHFSCQSGAHDERSGQGGCTKTLYPEKAVERRNGPVCAEVVGEVLLVVAGKEIGNVSYESNKVEVPVLHRVSSVIQGAYLARRMLGGVLECYQVGCARRSASRGAIAGEV